MSAMYEALQVEHSSTVDRVVEELRRALFTGQLSPGTPLREVALSEGMEVSRSTVREALGMLVAEGLAVRVPNKGVAVKQLSVADVHDVSRARAALETAGVRQWHDATPEDKERLQVAFTTYTRLAAETGDPVRLTEAHLAIHRALVGLTGSVRLLAVADGLTAEIRLALAHLDRTRGNLQEQVASHRRLLSMLEAGEVAEVIEELGDHLGHAEKSLLEATGHGTIAT